MNWVTTYNYKRLCKLDDDTYIDLDKVESVYKDDGAGAWIITMMSGSHFFLDAKEEIKDFIDKWLGKDIKKGE